MPLNARQLSHLFANNIAKYLSQHNPNRFYIIDYKPNKQFITYTCDKHKMIGIGNGTYNFINDMNTNASDNDICKINIRYNKVHPSPNIDSPMHPLNSFYPQLKNYVIGPYYVSTSAVTDALWQPVIYKHLQRNLSVKVLNFYNRELMESQYKFLSCY